MSCKFRLLYYIILVVKYRKKLLLTYGNFIKEVIIELTDRYKFNVECMEVDKDHIHILISSNPVYSPKFIVSIIKQYTTYKLYREFSNNLKLHFYKSNIFWSKGYFINSIGNASENTIRIILIIKINLNFSSNFLLRKVFLKLNESYEHQ